MDGGVLIVMFDIPNEDKYRKVYRQFMCQLKKDGYQMIQKSIYCKQIRNIRLAPYNIGSLNKYLDNNCDVKAIVMTIRQFKEIKIISGNNFFLDEQKVAII